MLKYLLSKHASRLKVPFQSSKTDSETAIKIGGVFTGLALNPFKIKEIIGVVCPFLRLYFQFGVGAELQDMFRE